MKPIILAFTPYYLPGYKGGGPIRSLANMVDRLSLDFRFKIVAPNHDFNETRPYPGIEPDAWRTVGGAEVFYLSRRISSLWALRRLICSIEHDVLYFNSFFSTTFTIAPLLLRRLGLLPPAPVILAPRGEFSPSALALKRVKKSLFLRSAALTSLHRGVRWQASSAHEEADIRRRMGMAADIRIVPNLAPLAGGKGPAARRHPKLPGSLKIIFLARVSRMKNLDGALKILPGLKGDIQFDIYGPIEDKKYWLECRRLIEKLPDNIRASHKGIPSHDQVAGLLEQYHLFFQPSIGENFGHSILEALLAGCPVLISDRTPWRELKAKKAGWDLPLEQPGKFLSTLQLCADMDEPAHSDWSRRAQDFGLKQACNEEARKQNLDLFRLSARKDAVQTRP